MAVRDGLSVVDSNIRNLIECNYWYERMSKGEIQPYRPIDTFMLKIKDNVDYMKKTLLIVLFLQFIIKKNNQTCISSIEKILRVLMN